VRANGNGELVLEIDGAPTERFLGAELAVDRPFELVRPNRLPFAETFAVSEQALGELARFLQEGGPAPWEWATELLADGLIDDHFALTPRGRRAFAAHEL
jgi:hypothetical protein